MVNDTRHIRSKPIPVIHNRYEVLNKCNISEYATSVSMRSHLLVGNCRIKTNKPTKKKHKILIIGDSHARGIASEIKHNLDDDFEIQGIVKPGSNLAVITHTVNKGTGALTKHDVVVVWGGTRNISRNETQRGLSQIRNFVEKHSQMFW